MKTLPIEYVENRRKYLLFKNDVGVSDVARWGQIYESAMYDYIRTHLKVEGTTILDVGANLGFHSIEFSEMVGEAGHVLAFEPQPIVYWQLCANLLLNSCTNAEAYNFVIGMKVGMQQVEKPDYYSETKINIGDTHTNAFLSRNSLVNELPLDSMDLNGISIIKIDVQGYEPFVLDGAINTIAHNRPTIFIEIEPGQLAIYGFTEEDVFTRLRSLGYSWQKTVDQSHLYDYVAVPYV
jgi:FkbM family methyltransferase